MTNPTIPLTVSKARCFRPALAWVILPGVGYWLGYVLLNLMDLAAGRPWHLYLRWFGMFGRHQWSPSTIFLFYVVFLVLAAAFFALTHRKLGRGAAVILGWSLAGGLYFLNLNLLWPDSPLFWRGGLCGILAGALTGWSYHLLTRKPTGQKR